MLVANLLLSNQVARIIGGSNENIIKDVNYRRCQRNVDDKTLQPKLQKPHCRGQILCSYAKKHLLQKEILGSTI